MALNDQELGRTDNMFRQYRWDVKGLLRGGPGPDEGPEANELLITFASPVRYAAQQMAIWPLPGVQQAMPGSQPS